MDPITAANPTSEAPPVELAWADEPEHREAPAGRPAAVSWPRVTALAGSILAAGAAMLGGAWLWSRSAADPPVAAPSSIALAAPPTVEPQQVPAALPVPPPPVTVTVTQPAPPLAPAAVPRVPAAAQEICGMLRQYPGMNRVDVALTLSDRTPHRPYDTTRPIVDDAVANYCPDQAR